MKNLSTKNKIIEDNPDLRNILHKCFDFNYVSRQSAYILANDPFFTLTKDDISG